VNVIFEGLSRFEQQNHGWLPSRFTGILINSQLWESGSQLWEFDSKLWEFELSQALNTE
jgi:hypothetical protein